MQGIEGSRRCLVVLRSSSGEDGTKNWWAEWRVRAGVSTRVGRGYMDVVTFLFLVSRG